MSQTTQQTKVTVLSVHFYGTAKGKRKVDFQSERLVELNGHIDLPLADQPIYTAKAFGIIDDKSYKNTSRHELVVNYAYHTGDIESIELIPKQRVPITRAV